MKTNRDVLVIEDDITFSRSLCSFMDQERITSSSAVRGDEACMYSQKYEYSAIIFDLMMLPPTFLDVAEKILAEQKNAVLICVSAHLDNAWFREKIKIIGFEYHEFYKPLTSADIDDLINICKGAIQKGKKNSIVHRFFDSVDLKPGWLGVAVDLKKLFAKYNKD